MSHMMKLSDSLAVPTMVMARQLGEEMVILDLQSGTYFGLDAVGARIWALASAGQTLAQVCDTLLTEYDVGREQLEQDVLTLAQALLDKRLAELAP